MKTDKNDISMDNNIEYEHYKTLKNELDIIYRGICLNRVLAIQIWNWSNHKIHYKSCFKNFFKACDFSFLESVASDNLLYTDIRRKDHEETFLNIAEKVRDKFSVINKASGLKSSFSFNIKNIVKALYLAYGRINSRPLIVKFVIAGKICTILNTIDLLYKLKLRKVRRFVAYSIVHERQNLLAQFYNLMGARVMGLTHGAQFIYHKKIPIDALNYENLNAECLVWGQMTKDEYINYGISPSKLYVAGYPKNISYHPVKKDNPMNKCIVLLCRKQYDESNARLLEILATMTKEISFSLKLHPSCDYDHYRDKYSKHGFTIIPKEVSLVKCMDNSIYDFSIAVNTSSYYEIQAAGIPCLRYDDGDTYDLQNGHECDRVSNKEELEMAIKWISESIKLGKMDSIISHVLSYNLGMGIDRYREILLS